jgi:aryl-alcohol dehydrogenase-like predicted oxidoreductase
VPVGTVDAVLSYCHNNLADNTLTGILPYLQEKKVAVISASFSSMGLLTQKVRRSLHTILRVSARCVPACAGIKSL